MSAEWNFMDPASRSTLLRTVRAEAAEMFDLAERTDWEAPTACSAWQVRDVVGHLIDVTEGYFVGFDHARAATDAPGAHGLRIMAERLDDHARAFRSHAREDVLKRGHTAFERMLDISEGLTDEEWAGLMVSHPYLGPVPAGFYPEFQLIDYTVHSWDIRERSGTPRSLSGDAADLLVPVMLIIWQATADPSGLTEPFAVGVRVTSGHNAGSYRFDCGSDGVGYQAADIDDLPTVLEFDPGSLVLTVTGRQRGGTVRGDQALADRFRALFFAI
jgi:uncharacterized Actinobacterial protein TIGR03083